MNSRAEKELKVLSEGLAATGLDAVTRIFPRKIIELQQIIEDSAIPDSPLNCFRLTERPERNRKLIEHPCLFKSQLDNSSGAQAAWIPRTGHYLVGSKSMELEEAYSIIKAESSAMVQIIDQALAWFLLSYCKAKNSFSNNLTSGQVSVAMQEALLAELHRAQEAGINIHASITKAHLARADLCSKIAEYPEIEDFALALQGYDEHQALLLRQNIRDLRNVYIALYDLVKAVLA